MKLRRGLWIGAMALSISACSDSTGPEANARIEVFLTDAPAGYLEKAEVCVSQVYLQGGESEDSGRTILWEAHPDAVDPVPFQCPDLLQLEGVEVSLMPGGVEVAPGTYGQLRLLLASAHVELKAGYTFTDGSTAMELSVPSGEQTGIKVLLSAPIVLEPETLTEITVDAPVEDNFRIQGNPESPAGIQGVLFTPVLREIESSE